MNKVFYDILIDYQTGDSFNTEEIIGEAIGIVTSDKDKAKDNLRSIKDHYKKYADSSDYDNQCRLELLVDDGVKIICPFWIGYFECLHGARIEEVKDDDMSFKL